MFSSLQSQRIEIQYRPDRYDSHCDVVVELRPRDRQIKVIGGNVGHSVTLRTFALTDGGFLAPYEKLGQYPEGLFAILRNNK